MVFRVIGGACPAGLKRCGNIQRSRQRNFVVNGNPGISEDEYEAVAHRFAVVEIKP
jgi:hypothetical protein